MSRPGTSDNAKLTVATNYLDEISGGLQPDAVSDMQLTIASESGRSENNAPELSALPGLLMDEIIKCLGEVGEHWDTFFRPSRPENLVSAALGTSR